MSVPNFQYKMECSFSAPKRGRASPAEDSPPPPAKMPAGAPDDAVNTDLDTDQALSPGPAAKVPLVVSTSYETAIFGDDDSPVHCSPGHSVSDLSDLVNGVLNPGPSRHVHDSPSSVLAVHAGGSDILGDMPFSIPDETREPLAVSGNLLLLADPHFVFKKEAWRLCRAVMQHFPEARFKDVSTIRSGMIFKLSASTRMLQDFANAFAKADSGDFRRCELQLPLKPKPVFDVYLRGVDPSFPEDKILSSQRKS